MFVDGNKFIEFVIIVYLLEMILLKRFEYSIILNCVGFFIICMVVLLI